MSECFRCARARYAQEEVWSGEEEDRGEVKEGSGQIGEEEEWDGGKEERQHLWERWAREQGKRWTTEIEIEGRGKARIPLWYRVYAPKLWVGVGM